MLIEVSTMLSDFRGSYHALRGGSYHALRGSLPCVNVWEHGISRAIYEQGGIQLREAKMRSTYRTYFSNRPYRTYFSNQEEKYRTAKFELSRKLL